MVVPVKTISEKSKADAPVIKRQEAKIEKSPSLKDTLTRINSIGNKTKQDNISEASKVSATEDKPRGTKFDESKINESLEVFLEKIKTEYPRLYSALKLYPATSMDEGIITLNFQNNTIVDDFRMRVKPALLSHLRTSMDSESLEIVEKVVEAEQMEKPTIYSDNEKLQHMITKNPSLQKLKSMFNLDFDR